MSFECWKCGACCRLVGFKAPELDRGDKACIHLTKDNLCEIYEDRPDFCRLNPRRDPKEQNAWCKLQEANWPKYVEQLKEIAMGNWNQYKRKGLSEMRPYVKDEDLSNISVSDEDDPPNDMGMVARNPKNYVDQWYVARAYFEENLELAGD